MRVRDGGHQFPGIKDLIFATAILATGCMRTIVRPNGEVRAWIIGNGHATVCQDQGNAMRARSALGAPQGKDVPVATEVPDVTVMGRCTEITGSSTSSNLAITIGLVVAAAAAIAAVAL